MVGLVTDHQVKLVGRGKLPKPSAHWMCQRLYRCDPYFLIGSIISISDIPIPIVNMFFFKVVTSFPKLLNSLLNKFLTVCNYKDIFAKVECLVQVGKYDGFSKPSWH